MFTECVDNEVKVIGPTGLSTKFIMNYILDLFGILGSMKTGPKENWS